LKQIKNRVDELGGLGRGRSAYSAHTRDKRSVPRRTGQRQGLRR